MVFRSRKKKKAEVDPNQTLNTEKAQESTGFWEVSDISTAPHDLLKVHTTQLQVLTPQLSGFVPPISRLASQGLHS